MEKNNRVKVQCDSQVIHAEDDFHCDMNGTIMFIGMCQQLTENLVQAKEGNKQT